LATNLPVAELNLNSSSSLEQEMDVVTPWTGLADPGAWKLPSCQSDVSPNASTKDSLRSPPGTTEMMAGPVADACADVPAVRGVALTTVALGVETAASGVTVTVTVTAGEGTWGEAAQPVANAIRARNATATLARTMITPF
jgi:hypothetical protein